MARTCVRADMAAENWGRPIGGQEFVPVGIWNDSGTCYINVALQCLLAMKNVRERYGNRDQVPETITHYIWRLLTERDSRMDDVTSPTPPAHFLQKVLFNGAQSGLVDDALLQIVRKLDKETVDTELKLQVGSRVIPPLMDDFKFCFQTKVICCGINHTLPARCNHILEMNLPIDVIVGDPQLKGKWLNINCMSNRWLRLEDLLKYMELEESMCCQNCRCPLIDGVPNGSNTKKVKISIEKLPQVLLISWPVLSEDPQSLADIRNQVMFEERISLIEFAPNKVSDNREYEYRLIATADFQTVNGMGHTTAFVSGSKYKRDGWIQFDDDKIKIIQPQGLRVAHWVSVYEKVV